MWCAHCQKEMDVDRADCPLCGRPLQAYTPILSTEAAAVLEVDETGIAPGIVWPEEFKPVFLLAVADEEEGARLAALLEGKRIPCLCKPDGEDPGVFNLFVPEMLLEKALQLVMAEDEDLPAEEGEAEPAPAAPEAEPEAPARQKWFGLVG